MSLVCFALFILFVALQFSDAILTWRVIATGGSERNPIMATLMRKIGMWPALLLFKTVEIVLVYRFVLHDPIWLFVLVVLYIAVVVHNWQQKTNGGGAA